MRGFLAIQTLARHAVPLQMRKLRLAGERGDYQVGAHARVEPVAEGVAQEIEGEDGGHHGERGKITRCGASKRWLRASLSMAPQLGMGARTPTPRKLSVDSARMAPAMADGGLDQHGLQNIREEMAHQDARVRSAQRARGEDVFHFLGLQNLCASEARVAGPAGDDERENYFVDSRAEECGEGNRQQDSGKRKKCVDEDDVDEAVEPAAEVARQRADRKADESRAEHDAER